MKNRVSTKSRPAMRLLAIAVICSMLPWGAAWGKGGAAPPLFPQTPPLSKIPVPEPPNLGQFLKSVNGVPTAAARIAAIQLGKALFWDMQVGSDGATACATCHFYAGADPIANATNPLAKRDTNQLNPGHNGVFANISTAGTFKTLGPINPLTALDFPFFMLNPVNGQLADLTTLDPLTGLPMATVARSIDDIVGSQGINFADFVALNAVNALVDTSNPATPPGPRQVTGRNAPSVINAVFNYSNFWDGRANNIFNGVNPFGPLDQSAVIYRVVGAALVEEKVAIPNASLASQATGPPLSSVEMSFNGRTFPELGKKLINSGLVPLGQQLVHPSDGVLGTLSRAPANKGLNTNYSNLIKAAFQDNLTSNRTVNLPTKAFPAEVGGEPFTQIEANFSLFFGLAVQLYEATLVSDQTPFDLFQAGNQNAMDTFAQKGFTAFDERCAVCHAGSEFTSATVGSQVPFGNPVAFTNNTTHNLIQQGLAISDTGFFNIGVRPTVEDKGRGGAAPSGLPLAFSKLAELQAQGPLPFVTPQLPAGVLATTPVAVDGSFKTPGLRNVELTAPYFHNGSVFSLEDVVLFYGRGGNFNNPEMAGPMFNIASGGLIGKAGIVAAFLRSLTDERVKLEQAPFDHPELQIPNGALMIDLPATGGPPPAGPAPGLHLDPVVRPDPTLTTQTITGTLGYIGTIGGIDKYEPNLLILDKVKKTVTVAVKVNDLTPAPATVICAANATGTCDPTNTWSFDATALHLGNNTIIVTAANLTGTVETLPPLTIQVLPVATIGGVPQIVTEQTGATLTVGGNGVVSYQFSIDGGAFSGTDIPIATPIILTGLADSTHTVAVIGKDVAGNQQPVANSTTATWTVKANPPVLTLNPVTSTARKSSLTIGGTVELGLIPVVRADTAVTIGAVSSSGGTWSCQISGLKNGVTNFTITATDIAQHVTSKTAGITIVLPDGNLKGTGSVDVSDAVRALRIAVGLGTASTDELLRGDVAPLISNSPAPDGKIEVGDALVILRKVVGLINF